MVMIRLSVQMTNMSTWEDNFKEYLNGLLINASTILLTDERVNGITTRLH